MVTEGDNPSNKIPIHGFDLNNGGWTIIIVLICIVVVLAVLLYVNGYRLHGKINALKKLLQRDLSEKEINMIVAYRELNDNNKTIINDTLKTLEKNNEHKKE